MKKNLSQLYDKINDSKIYPSEVTKEVIANLQDKQIRLLLRLKNENLKFAFKMYCEKKFTKAYNLNAQMDFVRMICNSDSTLKEEIFGFICDDVVVNCEKFTVISRKNLVNLLLRSKDEDVNLIIIDMVKFLASKNIYGIFKLSSAVLNTMDKEKARISFDLLTKLFSKGYEKRAFDTYGEEYEKYYSQNALSFIKYIIGSKYDKNANLCFNIILMYDFPVSARFILASSASKINTNRILAFEKIINMFSNEIKNFATIPFALTKISDVSNITFEKIEKLLFCNQLDLDKLLMLLSNENDLDNYPFNDADENENRNVLKKTINTSDKPHL